MPYPGQTTGGRFIVARFHVHVSTPTGTAHLCERCFKRWYDLSRRSTFADYAKQRRDDCFVRCEVCDVLRMASGALALVPWPVESPIAESGTSKRMTPMSDTAYNGP